MINKSSSPAERYNYKGEKVYGAVMACVFLTSVTLGFGEKVISTPLTVLLPKEVKKKKSEDELSHDDSALLKKVPDYSPWHPYSINQAKMILRDIKSKMAEDSDYLRHMQPIDNFNPVMALLN